MALDVGVNVIEVDGRSAPTLVAAPTSVGAFIGLTERGVPDSPVRISSLADFERRFGNYRSSRFGVTAEDGYLGYAVEGFFRNGGREAWISRVVGPGSTPATATLNNRATAAAAALRVAAGYRGRPDPGDWGERLRIDVRDDPRGSTEVAPTAAGAGTTTTSARLVSLSGFQVGRLAKIGSGAGASYQKIIGIDQAQSTISWTTALATAPTPTTPVATAEFALRVRYRSLPTGDFDQVEEHGALSMDVQSPDYAIDRVNHPLTGSRYIVLTDLSGTAAAGVENPAVITGVAPAGGVENTAGATAYAGNATARSGLFAFDTVQVQLLALPDAHLMPSATARASVVRSAIDYCAQRGDCMYVGSAPDRAGTVTPARALSDYTQVEADYLGDLEAYSALFQGAKVYGALYAPWIQVADPVGSGPGPTRFVPPDGHVMGVYARTELERGIHKAPAGQAAQVRGALATSATFTEAQNTALVRNGFVNGVRLRRGFGIVVDTSRTLSTDTRWWFVSTRLLFNFVKSTLRDGLRFVRQEPHSEELRRMVKFNVVTPFLMGLWRQGAFGSSPPDAVFSVKCDAENNPPAEVDVGNFKLEVYFYPVKPAETVIIVVGQQPSGATAAEA